MAFCTLPPLRQRVQTYARVAFPFRRTRTRWRLGLKRRFTPNLQRVRVLLGGKPTRAYVCTRCLKGGKVQKAV